MKRILCVIVFSFFLHKAVAHQTICEQGSGYNYSLAASNNCLSLLTKPKSTYSGGPLLYGMSALVTGMYALYSWWKNPAQSNSYFAHGQHTSSSVDVIDAAEHLDRVSACLKMHEGMLDMYQQVYALDDATQTFLIKHELNTHDYQSCVGTVMQHALHQECVQLAHDAARLNARMYQQLLADVIDAGRMCAHENAIDTACTMLDWAHACIRYARAACAGVIDGVVHTVHTYSHPKECMADLSRSAHQIVCCTMRILYECGIIETLIDSDNDALIDAYITDRSAYLTVLAERIKHHAQALLQPHGVRTTVASVTHMLLTGKCLHAIGKFFSFAARNASYMVQRIGDVSTADRCVVTAEGMFVQAAQDSTQLALRAAEQQLPKAQVMSALAAYEPPAVHIERIAKKYPQWATDNCKPLIHMLQGEVSSKGKLLGLHHDYQGYLELMGKVRVVKTYDNGMYLAEVFYNNQWREKSFFPKHWPAEKVVGDITEAMARIKSWKVDRGREVARAPINGVDIHIVRELDGRIVTAFPVLGTYKIGQ